MPATDASSRTIGLWSLLIGIVVLVGILLGVRSSWPVFAVAGSDVLRALWVVPFLVALHLGQLFLSSVAWRCLFDRAPSPLAHFYRLRIIREGIDSLLPVAQVGGEIVGARLLAAGGLPFNRSAASIIVDVTIELLTQVMFLGGGLFALVWLSDAAQWSLWAETAAAGALAAAAVLLAQRFGGLRALEALLRGMAKRWPALSASSLNGLHQAALDFYRRPVPLVRAVALHLLAWVLGSIETWAVLRAMGVALTPLQAFAVESLGMAARSVGFAIPAALGAQEGGFVLAAATVGCATAPALALSLVKRVREIVVGLIGLALWRLMVRRPSAG